MVLNCWLLRSVLLLCTTDSPVLTLHHWLLILLLVWWIMAKECWALCQLKLSTGNILCLSTLSSRLLIPIFSYHNHKQAWKQFWYIMTLLLWQAKTGCRLPRCQTYETLRWLAKKQMIPVTWLWRRGRGPFHNSPGLSATMHQSILEQAAVGEGVGEGVEVVVSGLCTTDFLYHMSWTLPKFVPPRWACSVDRTFKI